MVSGKTNEGLIGLTRYDADGTLLWANTTDFAEPAVGGATMAVHASGDVFLAHWFGHLRRYDADGNLIEAWPRGTLLDLAAGLRRHEDTILVMSKTLVRLDGEAKLLDPLPCLHFVDTFTQWDWFPLGAVAATDETALCGGEVYDLATGAVVGSLVNEASCGSCYDAAAIDQDYMLVGDTRGLSIARHAASGQVLWQREYERAKRANHEAWGVAVDGDRVAVVGQASLPYSPLDGSVQSNPFVIALDGEGEPLWRDQIAANGIATSVAFGTEGEIYVAGMALSPSEEPCVVTEPWCTGFVSRGWLRRYDPPQSRSRSRRERDGG